MKELFVSIVFLTLFSGCKQRNASNLSIKRGLEDLLKIETLPFQEQVRICTSNYFVFFGASGEGLGKVYVAEGAKSYFSAKDLDEWHRYEEQKEDEYWSVLQEQKQKMLAKLSSAKNSCSRVLNKVGQTGKHPGSYYLATILDGPKMNDSSIESWHFSLDEFGDVNLNSKFSFAFQNKALAPRQREFEILMGRDITPAINQLFDHFQGLIGQNSIDQTIYFFKSHGAEFRKSVRVEIPILEFLAFDIVPIGDSAMFFDSHDEKGLVNENQFFIPIWSAEFICTRYLKVTSKEFRSCVSSIKPQNFHESNTQAATTQFSSIFSALKGHLLDHSFWKKGTQGITIGSGVFGGPSFQSKKTLNIIPDIEFPLTKDNLVYRNIRKYNSNYTPPMAYRLMGTGLSLNDESNSPEFRLRLPSGSADPSLIVFDTCSSRAASSALSPDHKTVTWQPHNKIGAVILSNPMPLYITALDYSLVDVAQYSMLLSRLWPVTKEKLADNSVNQHTLDILRVLLTDSKTIDSDDKRVYSRIQTTSVNCITRENGACTEHSPFALFMTEYRYRLALDDLKQFFKSAESIGGDSQYYAFHSLIGKLFELDWEALIEESFESRAESKMAEQLFSEEQTKAADAIEKYGATFGELVVLNSYLSNPGRYLGKTAIAMFYPMQKFRGHILRSMILELPFRFVLTYYMEVTKAYVDEIIAVQSQSDSIKSFAKSYTTESMKDLIVLDIFFAFTYMDLIQQLKVQIHETDTEVLASMESRTKELYQFILLSATTLGILDDKHPVLKTAGLESIYDLNNKKFRRNGVENRETDVDITAFNKSVKEYTESSFFFERYPNLKLRLEQRRPKELILKSLTDIL